MIKTLLMKKMFTILFVVLAGFCFYSSAFAGNHHGKNSIAVKGVIKDQDGNPLGGATITEKGKANAVVAGANGEFSIIVADGATLTVSYVGFEPQDVLASTGDMVIVLIRRDNLSEVVVTALG